MSLSSIRNDLQQIVDKINFLSATSGGAVETCTVTFPSFAVHPRLCYTSPTEGFVNKTFEYSDDLTITVVKDTIIYESHRYFGDSTYIYEGQPVTALDEKSRSASLLVIHGDTILQYADNAPEDEEEE